MKTEQASQPKERTRLDNHLGPLGDKILAVLRKHGPLNDLQLDVIFTRKVKAPERENVLEALKAVNLIRCQPTGHGTRLWIPTKVNETANKALDTATNQHSGLSTTGKSNAKRS